jgi:hypothetical protein
MRQYRVLKRSYVNNCLCEPGTIVDLPDHVRADDNLCELSTAPVPAAMSTSVTADVGPADVNPTDLQPCSRIRLVGHHHTVHKDATTLEVFVHEAAVANNPQRVTLRRAIELVARGEAEWVGVGPTPLFEAL